MRHIAVSLKLYFDHQRTVEYVRAAAALALDLPGVREGRVSLAVLPSFLSIPAAAEIVKGTRVMLGAQDLSPQDRGPYTGEVSGTDLRAFGCSLVEVGHAERRSLFGEDDAMVAAKVAAALRNDLIPLLCVGEDSLISSEDAAQRCAEQILAATAGGTEREMWIGYEPIWAIGAAQPASPDHVRAVCGHLRALVTDRVPNLTILYGGSAGPGLLPELGEAVDGLFLGRFAHDPRALEQVLIEAGAGHGSASGPTN